MWRSAASAALALGLAGCVSPGQVSQNRPPEPPPYAPDPRPNVQLPVAPVANGPAFSFRGAMSQGGMVIGTAPAGTVSLVLDGADVPMASDGRFLIAFGRDHGPSATLIASRADGTPTVDRLVIAPRDWRIESLPIPRGTTPTPAFLAIRTAETDRIKAARTASVSVRSDGWRQGFQWPVIGRISGLFGAQRVYQGEKGAFHSGVDIAEPTGIPVRAPADGVVLLAAAGEPFSLEGHLLMIGHGMGLDSAFLHLSRIDVAVGQTVRQGEVIGAVGMTGRATGPHLHWAMTWRGERIDPQLVAGAMPGADGAAR